MKTSFRACLEDRQEDRQTKTGRLISANQTMGQTMKRNLSKLIVFTAVVASAASLKAGVSPHETISATIDGSKITITYGRPYSIKPGRLRSGKSGVDWCPTAKSGAPVLTPPRFCPPSNHSCWARRRFQREN